MQAFDRNITAETAIRQLFSKEESDVQKTERIKQPIVAALDQFNTKSMRSVKMYPATGHKD
jgi:hypothetical protein